MRRLCVRWFMLLVGVAVFAAYAAAAAGGYALVTGLFAEPPDVLTAITAIGVFTVVTAYLSYRDGFRRLLSTHPPIENRIEQLLDRGDRVRGSHYVDRLRP